MDTFVFELTADVTPLEVSETTETSPEEVPLADGFDLPEETHAEVEPIEVITDADRLLYNGLPVDLGGFEYEVFLSAVDMVGADRFLGTDGVYHYDPMAILALV